MIALGVCSLQPCFSDGRRFAASRWRLDYYGPIRSFPQRQIRWNALSTRFQWIRTFIRTKPNPAVKSRNQKIKRGLPFVHFQGIFFISDFFFLGHGQFPSHCKWFMDLALEGRDEGNLLCVAKWALGSCVLASLVLSRRTCWPAWDWAAVSNSDASAQGWRNCTLAVHERSDSLLFSIAR